MAFYNPSSSSSGRDQTGWNINAAQSQFVSELLKKAIRHYLAGEIDQWFWHLTALRENINYDLTQGKDKQKTNERKELDDLERNVSRSRDAWRATRNPFNKNLYAHDVRVYMRRIMDLLKALGYLPPKEDRTKLGF